MEARTKIICSAYLVFVLTTGFRLACGIDIKYDYIVVGAGSAGSVVANRLSSNPNNSVLLLEAGERPNLLSEIPNFYFYLNNTKYDWNYTVQMPSFPEDGIYLPPYHLPQGKVVGGCSSINAMIYSRGNEKDYNNWAQHGAAGWDWKSVLPLFKKSENNQNIRNKFHGRKGEMFVQKPSFKTSLAAKYLRAAKDLGYVLGDVNGYSQSVFMNPQLTVHNGRRWGSYKAFTLLIQGRRNFRILTSAFVRKVLFDGNRAKGVEVDYKNEKIVIFARKEVILSAGAIKSPQILMLSGIGPKNELSALGIPVVSDLPVGKNFHDHAIVVAYTKNINSYNESGLSMSEADYNEFLLRGKGILSDISTEAIGYVTSQSSNTSRWPDVELIFSTFIQPKSFSQNASVVPIPTSSCIAALGRPESRGEVTLTSTDPYVHPHIAPNYLSTEKDVKVMAEAIQKCESFLNTATMRKILAKIPSNEVPQCQNYSRKSYEYFACIAKTSVLPAYHLAGSCKMGNPNDTSSVVDPNLRVIGVEGLRVIDNSIMPYVTNGHTHAAAVMIGEKGSEIILEEQQRS